MGSCNVFIKPTAVEEIESIPRKKDRQRVVRRIEQLGDEPRPGGSHKLSGHDRYRLRCGSYRIVYAVADADRIVQVVNVGHRKDVYRAVP